MNGLIRIWVSLALLASIVSGTASTARAETSPSAEPNIWGLLGTMDSDFNNFDSPVWAIEQIGSRIYVGGKFTSTISGPDGRTEPRLALAAYDSFSGQLLADFTPDIRGGGVYTIQAGPDGQLFVGGEFTSVQGEANTAGLVKLDPRTGQLDPNWRAGLERPWSTSRPSARSIAIHGDSLYVAGNFSHISTGRRRVRLNRVARVSVASGDIDPAFNPLVSGGAVWDIALSPDASRLYLAGFFTSVNGDTTLGDRFSAVNTLDGSLVAGIEPFTPNHEPTGRQYAVVAVGNLVYVAGEEHMIQVLNASDLSRQQVYFTGSEPDSGDHPLHGGGDFQDLEVVGSRVYASCHCWRNVLDPSTGPALFPIGSPPTGNWYEVRSVMAFDGPTGELVSEFELDLSGGSGVWAIHGAPDGCLWAGGGISQSAGQWLSGLGRWCDTDGPTYDTERPSTPRGLRLVENTPGSITVTWTGSTDDVAIGGYEVYRSTDGTLGSFVGNSATNVFADTLLSPNVTYTYAVKAFDTSANLSWRTNLVTVTASDFTDIVRPSTVRRLESLASAGSVSLTWGAATDNVGVDHYLIYRGTDGSFGDPIGQSDTTDWTDTTADSGTTFTYAVRAVDSAGNVGWRSNLSSATP